MLRLAGVGPAGPRAGGRWFDRWARALVRKGLAAPLEDRGLDVRAVDMGAGSLDAIADYLAKIALEVAASTAKEGRDGNRTPFATLGEALETGLAGDCELWIRPAQTENRSLVQGPTREGGSPAGADRR